MPFNTGNAQWDQNLATLGGALFPDPSKIAQGYYYGSEARKAQLESNKLIDQGNWRADYAMKTQGGAQPALPTYYTPENVPGAFPIRNPPSNLPYTGSAPQAASPIANLAAMAANTTPAQGASLAQTVIPQFTTGRAAQLTGQPTAEAPPAPQTYGNDGSTPSDEGPLHPASINTTGGGRQQSGPAQHNGSPAPMPPGMTTPGLLALTASGALAGFDAATIQAGGSALAYELYNRGITSLDQFHQMLGATGAPQLGVADIGAASAANVANIGARAEIAKQNIVTGEGRRQFDVTPVQAYNDQNQPVYVPRKDVAGRRAVEPQVEAVRQGQTGAYGDYFDPKNPSAPAVHTTAEKAAAAGLQPLAASSDQQAARITQRIYAEPDPVARDQLIQTQRALAATPKDLDPKAQQAQQAVDYRGVQQIYAVPQKSVYGTLSVKEPSAFDAVAENEVRRRTSELALRPENRHLDPSGLRGTAINDLMQNPSKVNGLRLPTPAEVVQQRIPVKSRYTSAGFKGDDRLDTYPSPYDKPGEGSDHMMIRMVPKDYKPGGEPGKGAAATGAAPAATAAAAPTVNYVDPSGMGMGGAMPTGAAPTAAAPPAAPVASAAAAPAAPYTPPGPGLIEKLSSLWRGNTPPYVSPRPGQAAAPQAAPAVPGPAPTVSGGAPPGALGPARPGVPDGPATTADGRIVNVRGGWVFP